MSSNERLLWRLLAARNLQHRTGQQLPALVDDTIHCWLTRMLISANCSRPGRQSVTLQKKNINHPLRANYFGTERKIWPKNWWSRKSLGGQDPPPRQDGGEGIGHLAPPTTHIVSGITVTLPLVWGGGGMPETLVTPAFAWPSLASNSRCRVLQSSEVKRSHKASKEDMGVGARHLSVTAGWNEQRAALSSDAVIRDHA